jgi:peptidoglycan hydrolase CwlO-like protein
MSHPIPSTVVRNKDGDTVLDWIRKNSLGSLISTLILVCTLYLRSIHGNAMDKLDELQKSVTEIQSKVNSHDTQIKLVEQSSALTDRNTEKNFNEIKEQLRRIYDQLQNNKRPSP